MSVFANGLGVSGKATDNKTIAAMPDVCLSPPPPPAGPVPIPYPNFGMASDTTDGCTSVFIKGKEAGKKNASKYSKITGDEPATRSFGASVVTHNITGPLKFEAYSFDVMFEGGGAERFTDLTSTNHSNPGSGFTISVEKLDVSLIDPNDPCPALKAQNEAVFKAVKDASENPATPDKVKPDLKSMETSGTISHAFFKPAAGPSAAVGGTSNDIVRQATSLAEPRRFKKKDLVQRPGGEQMDVPQKICADQPPFMHTRGPHSSVGHAEPCILNELTKNGPVVAQAKITISIFWNAQTGSAEKGFKTTPKDVPCPQCRKALEAACKCMDIELCNRDGTGSRTFCKKPEADKE